MKDRNPTDADDSINELSKLIDHMTETESKTDIRCSPTCSTVSIRSKHSSMAPSAANESGSMDSTDQETNAADSQAVAQVEVTSTETIKAEVLSKESVEYEKNNESCKVPVEGSQLSESTENTSSSDNSVPLKTLDKSIPHESSENKEQVSRDETLSAVPDVCRLEVDIAEDAVSRVSSLQGDMCRICHCVAEDSETLISPCDCCGSMKWVHQKCLQRWVKSRDARKCELCGFSFNMTSSVKPFRKWKKLNMSSVERRRVLCSVTFHIVAITCVIWSLYVLIDRTTQEIQAGNLNWPFWTKLVVVAIGFTGGLVFMYVQCKTYVKLFRRWKQFNRVIYINDIQLPEDSDGNNSPSVSITIPVEPQRDARIEVRAVGDPKQVYSA